MSLKSHLETRESIEIVSRESWKFGRAAILERGEAYYESHPDDVDRIRRNLGHMGLDASPPALRRALDGIISHYYEKMFVLVKDFEAHWVIQNRVEVGRSLAPIVEAGRAGRAVFIGQSHFGATYLLVPVFMAHGIDVTFVALFPPPVYEMLRRNIERFAARWKTGRTSIVNLADSTATVPEIMFGSLSSGENVMNVFDENNAYSRPVSLLGRPLYGGSGMDRILSRFDRDRVDVVTPFLVRTGDDSFRLEADLHDLGSGDIVQDMYDSLGRRVSAHPEQWYFLQELHHSFEAVT